MRSLWITLLVAAVFWFVTFSLQILNFWLSMCIAVTILTALAFRLGGVPFSRKDWNLRSIFSGVAAAASLYTIFWLGNSLSQLLFHFAKPQIASIYGIRTQGETIMISLILLFITSPGEEIFWRGFVQRRFVERFGTRTGWLMASSIYAAVHIASGNFMLTMAALIAGLFWGWLYQREQNLIPCIVSHSLWTVTIFILLPIS
ncbi:MAG TPA: type II CAAX endopeptidase family protein [Negativicutes bacterium]|nr:type II CAAX endopeptidase family protein [Negativicutes bacterium]